MEAAGTKLTDLSLVLQGFVEFEFCRYPANIPQKNCYWWGNQTVSQTGISEHIGSYNSSIAY